MARKATKKVTSKVVKDAMKRQVKRRADKAKKRLTEIRKAKKAEQLKKIDKRHRTPGGY
jgi:hypothetical protein